MEQILLLAGALGEKGQFDGLIGALEGKFELHTLNFSGHGATHMPAAFSIELFAQNVLDYLEEQAIGQISIFGYSMGGYVALYLARFYPEKVAKVFTLGTKWEWTPEIAAKEVRMLDPEKIEAKIPAFAQLLANRHQPNDWKAILHKTAEMMRSLGACPPLQGTDFESVNQVVRIAIGDRDNMVTLDETIAVYGLLPQGQLQVFPSTPHPFEQVATLRLTQALFDFF